MRDFLLFVFLLLLVLALIAVGVSYYMVRFARAPLYAEGADGTPREVVFEVQPGETTADIAQRLEEEGLIRSAWLFQLYARFRRLDASMEVGRYELRSDMTTTEIIETLTQPPTVIEITFTVPEGLRLEEVGEILQEAGVVSAEGWQEALQQSYDYDVLSDRPAGASLEGYLFPDTYRVPEAFTATQVVDFMLQNFDRRFDQELRQEAQEQGLSIYDVVTLASIVEREAVVDEERPIVASVYLNRLDEGMLLEADPTVQYGLGYNERQGRWWPTLYFDELDVERLAEVDHDYNTYRYPGLPPGPICGSGLASLRAVVEPADTDYYYFVAKGDGSGEHAFARTLEEHNTNVARYRP
ncbi:MAG: endolytic transglycosylase MltG [Chloroflexia bacterium]|nr:endolytic transglycosylase MltG [Chloroflexia bacterium]